ncbi:hypothetical protein H0H87_003914, partial [Tephrocybe sp. NHM501043]
CGAEDHTFRLASPVSHTPLLLLLVLARRGCAGVRACPSSSPSASSASRPLYTLPASDAEAMLAATLPRPGRIVGSASVVSVSASVSVSVSVSVSASVSFRLRRSR